jgi:hypothetical protein
MMGVRSWAAHDPPSSEKFTTGKKGFFLAKREE